MVVSTLSWAGTARPVPNHAPKPCNSAPPANSNVNSSQSALPKELVAASNSTSAARLGLPDWNGIYGIASPSVSSLNTRYGIQQVAQAVTEQVEPQHCDEDGRPRQ